LAGNLVAVLVDAGDLVTDGQVVAVLESMKMQMELRAPDSAVVEAVHHQPGKDVSQGEALVTLRTA
jgi:biotin carboxyl carrier protein